MCCSIHQTLRQKCLRLRVAGIGGVHQLLLLECRTPAAAVTRQQPKTRSIPLIGETSNPCLNLFFVDGLLARGDHLSVIAILFLYRSSYPFGVLHGQRLRVQQLLRLRWTTLSVDTRKPTGGVRHILQSIGGAGIAALRRHLGRRPRPRIRRRDWLSRRARGLNSRLRRGNVWDSFTGFSYWGAPVLRQ